MLAVRQVTFTTPDELFVENHFLLSKKKLHSGAHLESTHMPGETYEMRMAMRNTFEAGMKASSFILVPGGVSQTAACDGLLHQVTPEDDLNIPGPVVLPI